MPSSISIATSREDFCGSNLHIFPWNPFPLSVWSTSILLLNSLTLCFNCTLRSLFIFILIFLDCMSCCNSSLYIIAICPSSASLLFETLGKLLWEFSSAYWTISLSFYLQPSVICLLDFWFIGGGIKSFSGMTSSWIL